MFPPSLPAKHHFLSLTDSAALRQDASLGGSRRTRFGDLTLYSGWTSRLEEVLMLWAESFESCSISSRRGASGPPPDKDAGPRGPPPCRTRAC